MLCLWLVFSDKGQNWLEYYLGIKVAAKGKQKKQEFTNDFSGDFGSGKYG
jgi:hypothetical protein